jgi:DNA repair protein RecO (recombination protein O)
MRYINTYGIILKKTNFGDYDQYITFFSPDFGKTEAVAKGARKINSQFMGHLEPLTICSMQIYKTPRSLTITQCQAEQQFKNLHTSYELSLISMLFLEIIQKTIHSGEHGRDIFELLRETLTSLNKGEKKFIQIEGFKIKLLKILGIMPETSKCFQCETKWHEVKKIYRDQSHFYCDKCAQKNTTPVSIGIIKLINYFLLSKMSEINKIKLLEKEKIELKSITTSLFTPYLDNELKTDKILDIYD